MRGQEILTSSASDEWATPLPLFNQIDAVFNFKLDAAATPENTKCPMYLTHQEDGLRTSWMAETVWLNPPYSNVGEWIAKAQRQSRFGITVVCLIPARTDTRAWHEHIWKQAKYLLFFKSRVKFVAPDKKNSAPFPSALVVFTRKDYPMEALSSLGHSITQQEAK